MFRRKLEVWLIGVAVAILRGRNVSRSMVVSRRDNNDMYAMSERLESIQKRMKTQYKEEYEA
jgi:hypothetical protein